MTADGSRCEQVDLPIGVYRIYRRMHAECRSDDAREIERACEEALQRNPNRDAQAFA